MIIFDHHGFDAKPVLLFAAIVLVFISSALLPAPAWVFAVVVAVPAAAMAVTLARSRRYVLLAGVMLVVSNGIAILFDAPNWIFAAIIAAAVVVISIRLARGWR